MFTEVLFTTAKTWKQPRCLSAGEINILYMEYYSVLKRNELSSHEKIWRENLKCVLLSKRSQS